MAFPAGRIEGKAERICSDLFADTAYQVAIEGKFAIFVDELFLQLFDDGVQRSNQAANSRNSLFRPRFVRHLLI